MSPRPDAVLGGARDTVATLPKDPRPPGLRLLIYRSNIDGLDAARGIQCDNAWLDIDDTPVRLRAQKPPEDEDIRKSKPPAPMGRADIVRARLAARAPSRLRYEVLPVEDAPAPSIARHKRLQADGQLAGRSGASSLAAVGREPTRAGLYGTRRCPTTATPRARTTAPHSPSTKLCRAPHAQADVDEEPPRTARPTRRVLAERLYGVLSSARPQGMPATAGPPRPTISAPMPLGRKRRRSDDADADPPSKRRACF